MPGAGIGEYLRLLAQTRTEHNTKLRRFAWTGPAAGWFDTATNLTTNESFRSLLESDAARTAMPETLEPSPFPSGTHPRSMTCPAARSDSIDAWVQWFHDVA